MRLEKVRVAGGLRVMVEGKIDTVTAPDFGTEISDELDDVKELILDFREVEYVSSLGLRVILELQKKMNEQGKMRIVNVNKTVMDVFNLTGFSKILTIE